MLADILFGGSSTVEFNFASDLVLEALFEGSTQAEAGLYAVRRVLATLAGVGDVSVTLSMSHRIASDAVGSTTWTPVFVVERFIAGSHGGAATFVASPSPRRYAILSADGVSVFDVVVVAARLLQGTFSGAGTLESDVTPYRRIVYASAGATSYEAAVLMTRRVISSASGLSTFEADVTVSIVGGASSFLFEDAVIAASGQTTPFLFEDAVVAAESFD